MYIYIYIYYGNASMKRYSLILDVDSLLFTGWLSGKAALFCEQLSGEELKEDIVKHIFSEIVEKG